jgi:hypothetical protein
MISVNGIGVQRCNGRVQDEPRAACQRRPKPRFAQAPFSKPDFLSLNFQAFFSKP